ncbi:MAG: tetratricopeptide repeat protein [Pseudomonadota bacterium]
MSKRDEAIALFERALALNPDFAQARALLSYMLTLPILGDTGNGPQPSGSVQLQSDLARAKKEARRSLEIDDRIPYAWVALARKYNFQGQPKDGLRAIQNALDLNPLQPVVLFVMADCLWSDGRPEEAIEACDRCIVLGPSSVFYSLVLSIKSCALIALKRYEDAVHCSQDAQARLKDSAYPFFGEICALGYLGRSEEAANAIQRAQRTIPGFNAALFEYLQPTADQRMKSCITDGFQRAGLA